uniref:SFRICE_005238 n=1 Tax=Spodoptera frugiperda TaxID=7108 RepID=A0A2H1VAF0_SPOFR
MLSILPRWPSGCKCDCRARGLGFDSRVGRSITGLFSVFRKFLSGSTESGNVPGPDLGLAERLLGVPERDLPLADPDRDLREPLLDLEAFCFGLPEALDLDEPDLLLCADPERDLLERAGELDLLLDAFEDRLELAERLDLGDSLPDFAGLRDTDLKLKLRMKPVTTVITTLALEPYLDWLPSLPGAGLGLLLRLALDPLSESEPESVSTRSKITSMFT